MDLSVTVIARDAAQSLARCLESVKDIASETIVVVDDRTTDETTEVAKSYGTKIFTRKFTNFADQKNFALSKTKGDWILSLDADEVVSDSLAKEIKSVVPHTTADAFLIPRLNIIFSKVIKHTNWEPMADTHIWLWRKNHGKWVGNVHEEVMVKGKIQKLKSQKIHYSYLTVEEFIAKMDDYTTREKRSVNPLNDFFRRYIWHLGFLDGWHGLFLSYLMVIYYMSVMVKIWEKKKSS